MKPRIHSAIRIPHLALGLALLAALSPQPSAFAQGTAFTYQGRLNDGGSPAGGIYDLRFTIYESLTVGAGVAGPLTNSATGVTNGSFTVTLDFGGSPFDGSLRWLEIGVRTNGSAAAYATLSPRQALTATPYAITADNVTGPVPAAQLTGAIPLANLPAAVLTNNQTGVTLGGTLTLNGNLNLPATTATAGAIYLGGSLFLHGYGVNNFFAGPNAGNLAITGFGNLGVGANVLQNDTSGYYNMGMGANALQNNRDGYANIAVGQAALQSNTNGEFNTAVGTSALQYNLGGNANIAIGYQALQANTSGAYNTANGAQALVNNIGGSYNTASGGYALAANVTGSDNTASGVFALHAVSSGVDNTAFGFHSLQNLTNGNYNLAVGSGAGQNLNTGSYNIHVGSPGVDGDNNTIRIGTAGSHTNAFVAGIYGVAVAGGAVVSVNSSGQLASGGTIPLAQLPSAVLTNNQTGVTLGGTFSGDGSGLTGISGSSGGTVTSVATGPGLFGGPITNSGTISIPSGGVVSTMLAIVATAGTSTKVTYNNKGLVLSGTNLAAGDIPNLGESQVTGLVSDLAGKVANNGGSATNLAAYATLTADTVVATNFTGNGAGLTNIPASAVVGLTTQAAPPGMALIPAGPSFTMGNSIGDGDITDATPISVTVSAFYMDVNLVSWSQWQSVYFWATNQGYSFVNAGSGKAANHPVQTVDWYDAVKWCNARSQQAGKTPVYYTDAGLTQIYESGEPTTLYPYWTATGYRLPT